MLQALSFILPGLGSTITNAIIIIAIIRSKYLRSRREIMVMFAVSVADFVEGFKFYQVFHS